jgi:hypothetical protein
MMSDDLEIRVQKLSPEKGDILLLTFPHVLLREQVDRVKESLAPLLARHGLSDGDLLILSDGAELSVIRRQQAAA